MHKLRVWVCRFTGLRPRSYGLLSLAVAFRRDAAFGLRALRRQPTFAMAAIATLAIGIGANAAVFSVVDAVLLRPLPYPAPERIVRIKGPQSQSFIQFGRLTGMDRLREELQASTAFSSMSLVIPGAVNLGAEPAQRIRAAIVMAEFFRVLGVQAQLGRTFTSEEVDSRQRLAVISDRLWEDRFSRRSGIIGEPMLLDGILFTIVGVMPPGVDFPQAARLWVTNGSPTQIGGNFTPYLVVGRLSEGVGHDDALRDVVQRSGLKGNALTQIAIIPLRNMLVGAVRPAALFVWAAAGLVFLIACMNTANLLLARVASREREFAVRRALGATRGQLIRQVLAESLVLATLGAVLAVPATIWTLGSVQALLPPTLHGAERIALDMRILTATGGLAVLTAVLFGLGPALSIHRPSTDVLRGVSVTGGDRFWGRFRSVLLIGEVAVALVLLVAAVTLVRTVGRIMAIDTGVHRERAIGIELLLPRSTYGEPDRLRQFYRDLEAGLREVPGVEAAGLTNELPGRSGPLRAERIQIQGSAAVDRTPALRMAASPGYFAAAGIELIAGRFFTTHDTAHTAPVLIVSEGYAKALGVTPKDLIGSRGAWWDDKNSRPGWAEIVGVVRDVRMRGPEKEMETTVHIPMDVQPCDYGPCQLVVRANKDPRAVLPSVRGVIRRLDSTVPLYNIQTFDEITAALLADRRFAMIMLTMFAGLGFVLAIVGLYGVLSYLVQARTREIGIRLAIGASHSRIRRQVLGNGLAHAALGILLGGGVVAASFRVVASRVPGLGSSDPGIIGGVAVLILAVAALATWIPAARATRVDPALTLRAE